MTSDVARKTQQEVYVCFLKPVFLSQLASDNDGCLAVCHIMAHHTSAHKASDCQQKLPGLVINFRTEKGHVSSNGGVGAVDLLWQYEHVTSDWHFLH